MKVRLIAYRKETDSATTESTYELELMSNPTIPLNFRFADIKNPEKRKASYSQTFKLPFTTANNEFFQNWFNLNLETLVYSSGKKFSASLYYGTIPQFEGYIQLKSVYQKAELYEVVLMSNTADLFSTIGEQKLQDVFKESNGSYTREFNHTFDATNILRSWTGTSSDFQNILGTALRDTDANVQKVMYNWSATTDSFYWQENLNQYMNMSDVTGDDAFDKMTPITQLRPAIQIRTLIKLIIARAGFTYTSDFIDCTGDYASDNYFGKLFMTLGNKLGEPILPSSNTGSSAPAGGFQAYNTTSEGWGTITTPQNGSCITPSRQLFRAGNEELNADPQSAWNTSKHYFTKVSSSMNQVTVFHRVARRNVTTCVSGESIGISYHLQEWDVADDELTGSIIPRSTIFISNTQTTTSSSYAFTYVTHAIDTSDLQEGKSYRIYLQVAPIKKRNTSASYPSGQFILANSNWASSLNPLGITFKSYIESSWASYSLDQYGAEIDIPACMDDTITQKAFLQDIIQRFNLVILADPNDPSNIIIEPYTHFISSGATKDWTDKLDVSKERVIKDTTSLQKKTINLSDLEDVDFSNKTIKEELPRANVYGKFFSQRTSNDFATGELKNNSIFSPYINCSLPSQPDQTNTAMLNIPTHNEFSYTQTENGFEVVLEPTKPKLFYYCGTPSPVKLYPEDSDTTYYLHQINLGSGLITPHAFTKYPVCSPYDIEPDADGLYQMTTANKSLYWNFAPPRPATSWVINWYDSSPQWEGNALYLLYWKNYLNEIYSSEARIMECYLNLDEFDIFDFKFNDQIFIKETYWRILEINNYQVGAKTSTKVTLIKVLDSLSQTEGCNYLAVGTGFSGTYVTWCPDNDPSCTPNVTTTFAGFYAEPECCEAIGGQVDYSGTSFSSQGLYRCFPSGTSLPLKLQSSSFPYSINGTPNLKGILTQKQQNKLSPFVRGADTGKYSNNIVPNYADDLVIKFDSKNYTNAPTQGESHRMVMTGFTDGTTSGYAYARGDVSSEEIKPPANSLTLVEVSGTSIVVGSTDATYQVGNTETYKYTTSFINNGETIGQIGTAGGVFLYGIEQTGRTSTVNISIGTDGQILFKLISSRANTKKSWVLNIDVTIQLVGQLALPLDSVEALYQDYTEIQLQNHQNLLWN